MKYKYILFDWDGCLAKTLDLWLFAYKQTLFEMNISKTDEEIIKEFGDRQAGKKLGASDNDKFFERVDKLVVEKMPNVPMYKNSVSVIKKLNKNRSTIAIVSSSLREFILPAMKSHNINSYFKLVITGEDAVKHKPDPESINLAMRKLKANVDNTIMIGDSDKDIAAARSAGIDSILFYPSDHDLFYDFNTLVRSNPTHICYDFNEIYQFLTDK